MLAPWKKSYDKPRQHTKKQRHYFVNSVHLVKAVVFPVVMYGCENWTIKKAECQRIDAFELWCWRRLLLLGIKFMNNLDNVLKGRDITLLTKACLVTAMVFPVVMYGCESWTIKKTEC